MSKLKSVKLQEIDDRTIKVRPDVLQLNMLMQVRQPDGGFDMDNFANTVDALYDGQEVYIVVPQTKNSILHEDQYAHMVEVSDGIMCCVIPVDQAEVLDETDDC